MSKSVSPFIDTTRVITYYSSDTIYGVNFANNQTVSVTVPAGAQAIAFSFTQNIWVNFNGGTANSPANGVISGNTANNSELNPGGARVVAPNTVISIFSETANNKGSLAFYTVGA